MAATDTDPNGIARVFCDHHFSSSSLVEQYLKKCSNITGYSWIPQFRPGKVHLPWPSMASIDIGAARFAGKTRSMGTPETFERWENDGKFGETTVGFGSRKT